MTYSMTIPVDVLRATRELLSDPARWLHGSESYAVDAQGEPVVAWDPAAVRWDLLGAIDHAIVRLLGNRAWYMREIAVDTICRAAGLPSVAPGWTIVDWHDAPVRTHAEMLAALDAAIQMAEATR